MSSGCPGRAEEPGKDPGIREQREGPAIPLGPLDPTIIHRARAVNADALRLLDDLLDQMADSGRR